MGLKHTAFSYKKESTDQCPTLSPVPTSDNKILSKETGRQWPYLWCPNRSRWDDMNFQRRKMHRQRLGQEIYSTLLRVCHSGRCLLKDMSEILVLLTSRKVLPLIIWSQSSFQVSPGIGKPCLQGNTMKVNSQLKWLSYNCDYEIEQRGLKISSINSR